MSSLARIAALHGLCFLLWACAPALDWRDVRPQGSGLTLLFPCKPSAQERRVVLAGQPVRLALHVCSAAGQTWGLALADLGDPGLVGQALADLQRSAAANIGAAPQPLQALTVAGATPHAASVRARLNGRLPDGEPVRMQVAVFTRGTVVYQASALGTALQDEPAEVFLASVRFQP